MIVNLESILKLTDTCVKCGLCLPHCPIYQKTVQEADSPRGRVALIQGFASGILPDTERFAVSIDRCLECHACEVVCPSGVAVTRLIDAARMLHVERQFALKRWLHKQFFNLITHPATVMAWANFYATSALRRFVNATPILQRLGLKHVEALLPERTLRPFTLQAVQVSAVLVENAEVKKGTIALFPGCLGRFLDTAALQAVTTILTQLGYVVVIPELNCCCGALYRHAGFADAADAELAQSVQIFSQYTHILTVASACFSALQQAPELATRLDDATSFIAGLPWPDTLNLNVIPQTVWVHIPCTQRYPNGNSNAAMNLLKRVPEITALPLPHNDVCCGAAGTYMLRQPKLSQALLADKLQIIQANNVQTLVTTNTGCALQLAAGLRSYNVKVYHPLEILAARLNFGYLP